jgi:hypothetical protein
VNRARLEDLEVTDPSRGAAGDHRTRDRWLLRRRPQRGRTDLPMLDRLDRGLSRRRAIDCFAAGRMADDYLAVYRPLMAQRDQSKAAGHTGSVAQARIAEPMGVPSSGEGIDRRSGPVFPATSDPRCGSSVANVRGRRRHRGATATGRKSSMAQHDKPRGDARVNVTNRVGVSPHRRRRLPSESCALPKSPGRLVRANAVVIVLACVAVQDGHHESEESRRHCNEDIDIE